MASVGGAGSTVPGALDWGPEMEEFLETFVVDLFQEDILSSADEIFGESGS